MKLHGKKAFGAFGAGALAVGLANYQLTGQVAPALQAAGLVLDIGGATIIAGLIVSIKKGKTKVTKNKGAFNDSFSSAFATRESVELTATKRGLLMLIAGFALQGVATFIN